MLLRNLAKETPANFLQMKYELKKALISSIKPKIIAPPSVDKATEPVKPKVADSGLMTQLVNQSEKKVFEKETMAMYPAELHSVYRERITKFYEACELKFKLNSLPAEAENEALQIILQLEDLWTRIDRCWLILEHWKTHNRLMPVEESEDFSKLSAVQLVVRRDRLETSISKRRKTIEGMQANHLTDPENKVILNSLNRKLEQLQQLIIDLETVKQLLKDGNDFSATGVAHRAEESPGLNSL